MHQYSSPLYLLVVHILLHTLALTYSQAIMHTYVNARTIGSWIESPKDPTTMYPLQHLCEPPKDTPLTKKSPSSLLVLKDKWTALHLACLKGHVDVVKELILNGADTSAKTNRENTALHIATQNNHFDVVTFLIQNGMDVNVRSWCLRTALHDASEYGCVDVAKVLLQNGADANIQMSFERKTPLLIAAMRKHTNIAEVLFQYGVDANVLDNDKQTVLHVAARIAGNADFVKVLIQNGADVNAVDRFKCTALHWAACKGRVDIAKILTLNGADVNYGEDQGFRQGPLYDAAYNGHVACTLQLLCYGARIDDEFEFDEDDTDLLDPISDGLNLLRVGYRLRWSLMSDEEKQYMWNLAFCFTWKHRVAAFKAYYAIRSFITYNGIFMALGYDLGNRSIWRKRENNFRFM